MSQKHTVRKFYPIAEPDIGELEERYVVDAVRSGWVSSLGRYVDEFERRFAAYCETKYGVTTCNGTAALHLALASLGVGPGDEVIVPTLTFVATANAVRYTGATPVFADAEPSSWCIDPAGVRRALSPRTRAIVVVHLYGHPADMDTILEIARPLGIFVIEDAAEAHGALYKGRKVGSLGHVGVFSFYGNKLITTGEGGALVTKDETLAERARLLRDHAMSPKRRYFHPEIGYNYRLTNLQAALGLAQLERIDELLAKKRAIMNWYRELLADVINVTLNPSMPWAASSYWLVCAVLPERLCAETVSARLLTAGIDTRPFFYPNDDLPMYRGTAESNSVANPFPVARKLAVSGISLPSSVKLMRTDVEEIVEEFKVALQREGAASDKPL
jgi:perosamine synthetase